MTNEHIYWTFSAAAQSIAAFVAFLLTGYALVYTLMEAARDKDDTLEEIHAALRRKYHTYLTLLSWMTGVAIVLSLAMVFINRWQFAAKTWLIGLTSVVDLVAIIGAVAFVVSMVNPRKYERAAEETLEEKKTELQLSGELTSSAEFFEEFRHLERLIRDYLRDKKLYVPSQGSPRMSFSFRQMIEALLQNEIIDFSFYNELLEINKYRNLVFHGHVQDADRAMVDKVRAAILRFEAISRAS